MKNMPYQLGKVLSNINATGKPPKQKQEPKTQPTQPQWLKTYLESYAKIS